MIQVSQLLHVRTYGRYYLQADQGGGRAVTGRGPWPREWETLELISATGASVFRDGDQVQLRAPNGQFVSCRTGSLTADVTSPGPTETFTLVMAPNEGPELQHLRSFGLRAVNNMYVSAEQGGNDVVNINRQAMLQWETFTADFHPEPAGYVRKVAILCSDGRHFLQAKNGGGGILIAESTGAAEWETFELVAAQRTGENLPAGAKVNVRTESRHYLQAEGGGGGLVNASGPWPREWETFELVLPSGADPVLAYGHPFALRTYNGQFMGADGGGGGKVSATATSVGTTERFTPTAGEVTGGQGGVNLTLSSSSLTGYYRPGAWGAAAPPDPSQPDIVAEVRDVDLAEASTGMVSLNPLSEVLWPGSIVDGSSWPSGGYRPITVPRPPVTLSTSVIDPTGAPSTFTAQPWIGGVRDAIAKKHKELIDHKALITADLSSEETVAHSEDQLQVKLHGDLKSGLHQLTANANFSTSSVTNKHVLQFSQTYFTIEVRPPATPDGWYSQPHEVDPNELYVSSVKYGRMLIFIFESHESQEDLQTAVDYAYKGAVSANVNFDMKMKKILKEARTQVLVMGGSTEKALKIITSGYEGIRGYLEEGGTYTVDTLAVPLGYTMRYVATNDVANVLFSTRYKERNVYRATGRFKVKNFRLKCLREGEDHKTDVYGWYWVASALVPRGGRAPDPQDDLHLPTHWHTGEGGSSTIGINEELPFGDDWEVSFGNWRQTKDLATIIVKGHLYFNEHDFLGSDKDMGIHSMVLHLGDDGAVGTQTLPTFVCSEGDQVQLRFDVEVA